MTTYIPTISTGLTTIESVTADNNSTDSANPFPLWNVFVGNYLALVIAVLFKQFWTAIYAKAKLIEPFVRLTEGNGVPASAVLSTFYLSSNIIPDPILAFSKRLWIVLWTSSAYFAVGFLAPVSSELLFLNTKYTGCPFPQPDNPTNPCWPPRLSIDPVLSRIVQGLLTYIAIMTLSLLLMTFRLRTGIYSDPSSIASITALVHHPDVIEDFRTLSEDASIKNINQLLGDRLYKLGEYQRQDGTCRYGLVPAVPAFQNFVRDGPPPAQKSSRSRRKFLDMFLDILFLLVLLALLGIVVAYYLDGRDDAFNRFFNSTTFGPKFVLTGVGTLIAIAWKKVERGKWKQFLRDSLTLFSCLTRFAHTFAVPPHGRITNQPPDHHPPAQVKHSIDIHLSDAFQRILPRDSHGHHRSARRCSHSLFGCGTFHVGRDLHGTARCSIRLHGDTRYHDSRLGCPFRMEASSSEFATFTGHHRRRCQLRGG